MRARAARLALVGAATLGACGRAAPSLDTSCPAGGSAPELLFAELAERGIPAPPDTERLEVGGEEIVVGWKNLLSGRELTLSCAYRRRTDGWSLLHARVDDGTHALQVSVRESPPGLIYRDAAGRLLAVVELSPVTEDERAH